MGQYCIQKIGQKKPYTWCEVDGSGDYNYGGDYLHTFP